MDPLAPARTIAPPPWMRTPESLRVMGALNEGGKQQARFVGGCVRNELLELPVTDIDIATILSPDQVMEALTRSSIKAVPTGIDYGTVTAVVEGKPFEITTLRKDIETDGRRAVVAYSQDWREDAARRDFTMNTLLADGQGNIYDPTGRGLEDLQKRRVVFVGNPAERIAEDYLRILRFFRFHAWYGKGEPEREALEACRAAAEKIRSLSAERITREWFKILSVDDPVDVLGFIFENNILKEFSSPEYKPDLMRGFCHFQKRHGLIALAPRLLVLAGLEIKNVESIKRILLIPKVLQKDIESFSEVLKLPDLNEDHAVRVAVYKYGRVAAAQALMIELAQDRVMNNYAPKALEIIQKWEIPNFPVSGDDLVKAGIPQGPALGQKLLELEEWWIDGGFTAGKVQLVEKFQMFRDE